MSTSRQAPPVTFMIDNVFANKMGATVRPVQAGNEEITLGDIFKISLELPNVRAAIVTNYVYAWELQGKRYVQEEDTYKETLKLGYTTRLKMEKCADFFRKNAHWVEQHNEMQGIMNDPNKSATKLFIYQGPYDKSEGMNIDETVRREAEVHGDNYDHMLQALVKAKLQKGDKGEQSMIDFIKNTNTNSHVYVLSDDFNAFEKSEEMRASNLETGDKNRVSFCSTQSYFEKLLHSPEACEYITMRLKENKRLPEDFKLDSQEVTKTIRNMTPDNKDNLRGVQVNHTTAKNGFSEVIDLANQFQMAAGLAMNPYMPEDFHHPMRRGVTAGISGPQHHHGAGGFNL